VTSHSPGILVLIYERKEAYVPLEVLSIEDGKSLRSLKHLHRSKRIELIEQFDEKFFIKQEGENLQILDVSGILHTLLVVCQYKSAVF
jgi:hypothetical protein